MVNDSPLLKDINKFNNIIEIFAVKGYHSATMEEIAQAIGVAKGTLYYHYKNKEDLYYSVIQYGIYIFEQSINQALQNETDPVVKIKKLIRKLLNFFDMYLDFTLVIIRELYGNNSKRDLLKNLILSITKIISAILEEGKSSCIFNIEDMDISSAAIFGAVSTSAILFINQKEKAQIERVQHDLETIIFSGILASDLR